jgi:hypothetical protein
VKLEVAEKLANVLRVTARGRSIWRSYIDRSDVRSPRIVFTGGKTGEHSLDVGGSSRVRIVAHWLGYIETNGFVRPVEGDYVLFPSSSMPGGRRNGKVSRIAGTRGLITYRYAHGGQAAPKWVPLWEIRVASERGSEMNEMLDRTLLDRDLAARVKALVGSKK